LPFQINNDRAENLSSKEAEELLKKADNEFELLFIRSHFRNSKTLSCDVLFMGYEY